MALRLRAAQASTLLPSPPLFSTPGRHRRVQFHGPKSMRSLYFRTAAIADGDINSNPDGATPAEHDWLLSPSASPYQILGVDPSACTPYHLKAAFRARVKEFHPDVCKDIKVADKLIKRVIEAYKILSESQNEMSYQRELVDPFDEPECEAYDLFINEVQCVGKGCPYSCVKMAPYAFGHSLEYDTAHVISQEHGDDYKVHLSVGRCPTRCIHYVTPSQRAILDDLLQRVLDSPYDLAEASFLDCLISKAKLVNNRYQEPNRSSKDSSQYVDWF